jgi:hypothetical protein
MNGASANPILGGKIGFGSLLLSKADASVGRSLPGNNSFDTDAI